MDSHAISVAPVLVAAISDLPEMLQTLALSNPTLDGEANSGRQERLTRVANPASGATIVAMEYPILDPSSARVS